MRRNQKKGLKNVGKPQHHPKTHVVVAIVGVIPVAIRTTRVVSIVVPRATAKDLSGLPDRVLPPSSSMIAQNHAGTRSAGSIPRTPSRVSVSECGVPSGRIAELFNRGKPQHHPKTHVVAASVGETPEAIRTTRVVTIDVPRATAKDHQGHVFTFEFTGRDNRIETM